MNPFEPFNNQNNNNLAFSEDAHIFNGSVQDGFYTHLKNIQLTSETLFYKLKLIKNCIRDKNNITDKRIYELIQNILVEAKLLIHDEENLVKKLKVKSVRILEELALKYADLNEIKAFVKVPYIHKIVNISIVALEILKFESDLIAKINHDKNSLLTLLIDLSEDQFKDEELSNCDPKNRFQLNIVDHIELLKKAKNFENLDLAKCYQQKLMVYFESKPFKKPLILDDLIAAFEYSLISSDIQLQNLLIAFLLTKRFTDHGRLNCSSEGQPNISESKVLSWPSIFPKNQYDNARIITTFLCSDPDKNIDKLIQDSRVFEKHSNDHFTPSEFRFKLLTAFLILFSGTFIRMTEHQLKSLIDLFKNFLDNPGEENLELQLPALYIYTMLIAQVTTTQKLTEKENKAENASILDCLMKVNKLEKSSSSQLVPLIKFRLAERKHNIEISQKFLNQLVKMKSPVGLMLLVSFMRAKGIILPALKSLKLVEKIRDLEDPNDFLMTEKAELLYSIGHIKEAQTLIDRIRPKTPAALCILVFNHIKNQHWSEALALLKLHKPMYKDIQNNYFNYLQLFFLISCKNISSDIIENDREFLNIFSIYYQALALDALEQHPLYNNLIAIQGLKRGILLPPQLKLLLNDNEIYSYKLDRINTLSEANAEFTMLMSFHSDDVPRLTIFAIKMYEKRFYELSFNTLKCIIDKDLKNTTAKTYIDKILEFWKTRPAEVLDYCHDYHKTLNDSLD